MISKFKTVMPSGVVYSYSEYTSKNVIGGDTDSAYLSLSKIFDKNCGVKDVVAFADSVGVEVNSKFPTFMANVFNAPKERLRIIKTNREVVSDKSIFLAKKMYVMHVVDFEGIPCDKLKIMGVSIKKSDTPVIVQDFLKELVVKLMDNVAYEEIKQMVKEFKDHYYTLPAYEIGRPIGVKSFNNYANATSLKGVPYHIKAALAYNLLCSDTTDKKINSSSKIRVCYIKHPKYKTIGIPVDSEENIPEFVNNLTIDYDANWASAEKKINQFLKPIGYTRECRQATKTKAFLKF